MSAKELETRVAALEAEVSRLKARMDEAVPPKKPWWEQIAGTFEGDPYYKEAMRLGRKYRESLRPKPRAKKK
jgi:hypothetical protein